MKQVLQEIVETNAEEEFEFPTDKKQKLKKSRVRYFIVKESLETQFTKKDNFKLPRGWRPILLKMQKALRQN